jgi:hypothetical protein
MRQMFALRSALLIGVLLYVLSGCVKKIADLPFTSTLCSVQTMIVPSFNTFVHGPLDTIRFSYDSYGNPVTIARQVTATGIADYIFMYDKDHRLTDLKGVYSLPDPGGFDTWHRFNYKNGHIVSDTVYEFGSTVNGMPASEFPQDPNGPIFIRDFSRFASDAQGRISVTSDSTQGGYKEVDTYSYNKEGNLAQISSVFSQAGDIFNSDSPYITIASGYDNKVNISRTNPIWQFLDRDYSVNNRFVAGSYNEAGLPTLISHQNGTSPVLLPLAFVFLDNILPESIQYNCEFSGISNGHSY